MTIERSFGRLRSAVLAYSALGVALVTSVAQGAEAGGALPKGPLPKGTAVGPKINAAQPTCFSHFGSPLGSRAHWSKDGTTLWFVGELPDGKTKANVPRHTLYKIDVDALAAEAVLTFELRGTPRLIVTSEPPRWVTIAGFTGPLAACSEGEGTLLNIIVDTSKKSGERAMQMRGRYALVGSLQGFVVEDTDRQAIITVDPDSLQIKNARKIPGKERPLYFDATSNQLVTYRDDGKTRTLLAYGATDANPRQLVVGKDEKVLIDGERFALVRSDVTKNRFLFRELSDWTQMAPAANLTASIPQPLLLAHGAVEARLRSRVALVQGTSFFAKQEWQRVFAFDYGKGRLITTVQAPPKQYVETTALDRDGTRALVEFRDIKRRQTQSVEIYDLRLGSHVVVALPRPPTPATK